MLGFRCINQIAILPLPPLTSKQVFVEAFECEDQKNLSNSTISLQLHSFELTDLHVDHCADLKVYQVNLPRNAIHPSFQV